MTNYMHSEWIPFSAKTRTLLLSLLLGIGCSGVGGDSSTSPDADVEPIRIGLLVPVTGSWARGLSWNQAAQLAIDEINESGGVLGSSRLFPWLPWPGLHTRMLCC